MQKDFNKNRQETTDKRTYVRGHAKIAQITWYG